MDETFFTVVESKKEHKENGKEYRGISRNKLCVAAAYDEYGHVLLITENTSKPSNRSTWIALGSHIKPGSHLVHDGERAHSVLIEKLILTHEVYDSKELKKFPDEENPLDPINEVLSLAKRFMSAHGGYNRENLQDWMNLIAFLLSATRDRYEKIDLFINLALNSTREVKYREVMCKNPVNKQLFTNAVQIIAFK